MPAADLLNLSELVASLERDLRWRYGLVRQPEPKQHHFPTYEVVQTDQTRFANQSPEIDMPATIHAIDAVLSVYPDARWTVSGAHGRIIAGDRLVSLAVALIDPDAELVAWIDAAGRLGDGNDYR